ncbi:hypothetical protein MCQ_01155 [Candidatus Bartonella washoeensis Sb944nv]|uniref:Uncharacterized protein n=1 Tax=Candidatus Bartonella washoeensis Sb944nv TaxID=1094563 RepID=J0Q1A4_9HYPH|nr:hypothetical protein [Bartonella washoeensis]EJF78776.1 hypothetical protein MCQ_01155 [Bartonella washoeensis Sb944nv]
MFAAVGIEVGSGIGSRKGEVIGCKTNKLCHAISFKTDSHYGSFQMARSVTVVVIGVGDDTFLIAQIFQKDKLF